MSVSVTLYICVCVSVTLYVCVSVTLCLSVTLYICVCVSVTLYVCVSVTLCLCVCCSMSVCLVLCVSVTLYVCVSVTLYVCVSVTLYVCYSVCLLLCMSVTLYVCVSVTLYVCVSVALYVCYPVCLCVCYPVCLCVCCSVCLLPCMSVCLLLCMFVCPDPKPPAQEVKFYTLNRKSTKKSNAVDPYSRLVHNIEVDSRLRKNPSKATPTNGHDIENRRSYSFEPHHHHQYEPKLESTFHSTSSIQSHSKMNGKAGGSPDKQLARAVLSHRIKKAEEQEKRNSREINVSPVSTKGEVTATVSTKSSDSENKRWSANSPLQKRKLVPGHVADFSKAGSAPPALPPKGQPGESAVAPGGISKAAATKQLNTVGKKKPLLPSKKGHPEQKVPLLSMGESTESDIVSPGSEDVPLINYEKEPSRPASDVSTSSSQNYDHLEEFVGKKHDSWESFGSPSPAPPTITQTPSSADDHVLSVTSGQEPSSRLSNGSGSNESGVYDHLPDLSPLPPSAGEDGHAPNKGEESEGMLGVPTSVKRNVSAPSLTQPSQSARASPNDQFGRFGSIDEESSEEELEVTPTNSDEEGKKEGEGEEGEKKFEGVTLRQKRRIEDPFADLLSPKASARLRWSQELNPLFDYRGFKADGVKLYDSSPVSKLLQSTMATTLEGGGGAPGKPPSIILEDEGEQERAGSSVSYDDTQSEISIDTMQSPTSPCSSFGEVEIEISSAADALTTMPRVRSCSGG